LAGFPSNLLLTAYGVFSVKPLETLWNAYSHTEPSLRYLIYARRAKKMRKPLKQFFLCVFCGGVRIFAVVIFFQGNTVMAPLAWTARRKTVVSHKNLAIFKSIVTIHRPDGCLNKKFSKRCSDTEYLIPPSLFSAFGF
jgi:hypothetical protein